MNDESSLLDTDTITVSLGKHQGYDVLIVDDKNGANDRGKKEGKQKIRWRLDSSLKGAAFVELDVEEPGFEWLSWPPPKQDIFYDTEIHKSGDLTIDDLHETEASDGLWIYKLRVRASNGDVYQTTIGPETIPPKPGEPCVQMLLASNPIIINR